MDQKATPSATASENQRRYSKQYIEIKWRTERDSNPRYGCPYTRVPGVRLQPLGHLSVASSVPLEWAQYTDAADEGKHLMKFFLSNWSELGDS
jgi:hypothetical protein